jgi:hypothetical protein
VRITALVFFSSENDKAAIAGWQHPPGRSARTGEPLSVIEFTAAGRGQGRLAAVLPGTPPEGALLPRELPGPATLACIWPPGSWGAAGAARPPGAQAAPSAPVAG